jgi:electron transport complex protein RnfG
MQNYFRQAWLVLLLAATLSGGLALVDRSLDARIAANARDRLLRAVFEVVPGGSQSEAVTLSEMLVYRVRDDSGRLVGWGVPAETIGFADKIQLMIGLDADAQRITGLVVLESKETPGLGEKVRDAEFVDQFVDQPAAELLEVVKAGQTARHPVQAVTGATISSKAVTEGVNRQLVAVRQAIALLEKPAVQETSP